MKTLRTILLLALPALAASPDFAQADFEAIGKMFEKKPAAALDSLLAVSYPDFTANSDVATGLLYLGLKEARKQKDLLKEAKVNDWLGTLHYLSGRYDSSLHRNLEAIRGFEALGLEFDVARMECGIGHQLKRQNLDLAFQHFRRGIGILKSKPEYRHELGSHSNNFGVLFEFRGDLDSALYYYEPSLDIKEEVADSLGIPFSMNNIAKVLAMKGNTREALDMFRKAYEIRLDRSDAYGVAENQTLFGDIYLMMGKAEESIRWFRKSVRACDSLNLPFQNQYNFSQLAEAYALAGRLDEAMSAVRRSNAIKDSLFTEKSSRTLLEMERKFETEKKEKDNALLRARTAQQQLWIYASLALLALAVLGGILRAQIIRRKEKAQRDAAIIAEREAGIKAVFDATEDERRRLAKELHDGVGQQLSGLKLALSRIAPALSSRAPEERETLEKITEVLDEAATDVRSISHAMMPRALQESGLVPAIDDMLRKSLGLAGIDYRFEHYKTEGVRFDERVEVGVYRIAQELIGNVIKHANAAFVSVQLFVAGGSLILIVEDNGRGMANENADGIGMLNIASRLNTLNGQVNYEPAPDSGTVATVRIPISN
jgi:signal transduction histidine kinase